MLGPREIRILLDRVDRLERERIPEKPPSRSRGTTSSSSNHSPAEMPPPLQRGSIRSSKNPSAGSNTDENVRRDVDIENHSSGRSQQNNEHQGSPFHPPSTSLIQSQSPNGRQASPTDISSRIRRESTHRSSRTGTSTADSDIPVSRETSFQGLDATSLKLQPPESTAPQDNGTSYFYGESSNMAIMQEVHNIISPPTRGDLDTNTDSSRGAPSIYLPTDSKHRLSTQIRDLRVLSDRLPISWLDLPPRSLADHLLECYFDRVYILYPFLYRPTFEAAYKNLWVPIDTIDMDDAREGLVNLSDTGLGNHTDSGPQSRIFYGGLNAIFALSCQFSDLPTSTSTEASNVYLERAMMLLLDAGLLDHPTISLVQVLLLICLHLQSTPLRNRLWNIIGLAVRMAQGLGLGEENSELCGNCTSKSILAIEMRRRTWYSCVMLDS